jgi:LmbE family N-acetylglucosaminyl deacetylase
MTSGPVLVVAAHPDDEVLGAGGTIARHAAAGDPVVMLLLGEGVTSRHPTRESAPAGEVDALRGRARAAGAALGVKDIRFEALPDNRFDRLDLLDVVKRVEAVVADVRPRVVYTHHPGDLNVDHQVAFRATLTATRPLPGGPVAELLAFEVLSSTEWAFGRTGPVFAPTLFVDVTATLDAKLQALGCYGDEIRPAPHARSLEAVRAAAVRWGATAGLAAAEAFEIVRVIR